MVQEMARKTANKMADQAVIDPQKIHIFAYGLELLYSSLAGVLALIIISAVGKKPFLWVPYLAGFVPLRLSGGGYHAKTHFHCVFEFSLLYSLVLLIVRACVLPMIVLPIVCTVTLVIILIFSPVTAPNKPLKECQHRTSRQNSITLGIGTPLQPQSERSERRRQWVRPSGTLGGEIPVELLWSYPQAKQPFVLLSNFKNNHLRGNYEARKYIEKSNCSI